MRWNDSDRKVGLVNSYLIIFWRESPTFSAYNESKGIDNGVPILLEGIVLYMKICYANSDKYSLCILSPPKNGASCYLYIAFTLTTIFTRPTRGGKKGMNPIKKQTTGLKFPSLHSKTGFFSPQSWHCMRLHKQIIIAFASMSPFQKKTKDFLNRQRYPQIHDSPVVTGAPTTSSSPPTEPWRMFTSVCFQSCCLSTYWSMDLAPYCVAGGRDQSRSRQPCFCQRVRSHNKDG